MTANTIGSQTKSVTGKVAKLYVYIGATYYFFGSAKNWKVAYGYKEIEEYVAGAQDPYVLTGGFHGEFDFEHIKTTDALLAALAKASATTFEVPSLSWQSQDKDSQTSPTTHVTQFTAKVFTLARDGPADSFGVVKLTGKGLLTTYPAFDQGAWT